MPPCSFATDKQESTNSHPSITTSALFISLLSPHHVTFPHIDSSSVYIGLCSSAVCSLFSLFHSAHFLSATHRHFLPLSDHLLTSKDLLYPVLPLHSCGSRQDIDCSSRLSESVFGTKSSETHYLNKTRQSLINKAFCYSLKTNSWFNVSIVKRSNGHYSSIGLLKLQVQRN